MLPRLNILHSRANLAQGWKQNRSRVFDRKTIAVLQRQLCCFSRPPDCFYTRCMTRRAFAVVAIATNSHSGAVEMQQN